MKQELQKTKEQTPAAAEAAAEIKIGSLWIKQDGDILQVAGFDDETYKHERHIRYNRLYPSPSERYGFTGKSEFLKKYVPIPEGKTLEQYIAEAVRALDSGDISAFDLEELKEDHEETGLISASSEAFLSAMTKELEVRQNAAEVARRFMQGQVELRQRQLQEVMRGMKGQVAKFRKKIKKINRLIDTIQLYLGIDEDITQIQEGEPAPEGTPITFRQKLRFFDEEMALLKYNCDWQDVEDFDRWLLMNDNYKRLLPEPKGIIALRPRREKKDYGNDWFLNLQMNAENFKTYLLIRNGENIYRIYCDLTVWPRLFPKRNELAELFKGIEKEWSSYSKEMAEEKAEDAVYNYKRTAFVFQGLVDRTDIFKPMPAGVKIFDVDREDVVNFIYDDEDTLPDGRLRFKDFQKQVNSHIKRGTRVLLTGKYDGFKRKFADRYFRYYSDWRAPELPNAGVYSVESRPAYTDEWGKEHSETLFIRHNPGGEVIFSGAWEYDPHERKNRISFIIKPNYDNFLINYDLLDLETVEFYLFSGIDRSDYLRMIPVLLETREQLIKETAEENDFLLLIQGELMKAGRSVTEAEIRAAFDWWKKKVIFKRPITKDTPKAYRMIIRYLKNGSNETAEDDN